MIVAHNLTNLTRWIWKEISAHVDCSMKKGKSPTMTSCSPPTWRVMASVYFSKKICKIFLFLNAKTHTKIICTSIDTHNLDFDM